MRSLLSAAVACWLCGCSPPSEDARIQSPYFPSGECKAPAGRPTIHNGSVTGDEVWTADGSPHLLVPAASPYSSDIFYVTGKLTLEPCATVLLGEYQILEVSEGGALVASGTATRHVVLAPKEQGKGWSTIRGSNLSFDHTDVVGGGMPARGSNPKYFPIHSSLHALHGSLLHANHLVVRDSLLQGINGGFTADSAAVTVTGSRGLPIETPAALAGTIPSGTYVGNQIDALGIEATDDRPLSRDVTLHDRGVPYLLTAPAGIGPRPYLRIDAGAGKLATLTIDPGVVVEFGAYSGITIGDAKSTSAPATGALVAVGTADKHIRLIADARVGGPLRPWFGLRFGGVAAANTRLDFVDIELAGQSTVYGDTFLASSSCPTEAMPNDAAIRIFDEPGKAFITNTTITKSAAHGIDRGWTGAVVDFLPTNTFDVAMGKCKQTYPTPASGACPTPPPCP